MNKEITKKIVIAIVIVTLFNYTSPTVSHAIGGGTIFDPIVSLVCTVSDFVIEGLQYFFVGNKKISYASPHEDIEYTEYRIRYSPGIIFSGEVAPFKINFLNASEEDSEQIVTKDFEYIHRQTLEKKEEVGWSIEDRLEETDYYDPTLIENVKSIVYCDPETFDHEYTEIDYLLYWTDVGTQKDYVAIMIDATVATADVTEMYVMNTTVGAMIGVSIAMVAVTVSVVIVKVASLLGKTVRRSYRYTSGTRGYSYWWSNRGYSWCYYRVNCW